MSAQVATPTRLISVGGKKFPETRWREAILFYLFTVWSGKEKRGKLSISLEGWTFQCYEYNGSNLNFPKSESGYHTYPNARAGKIGHRDEMPVIRSGDSLLVVDKQTEKVEVGLARFVKDDSIQMLIINYGKNKVTGADEGFALWKKSARSGLGFSKLNGQ